MDWKANGQQVTYSYVCLYCFQSQLTYIDPLQWDNEFFTQLMDHNYTLITGSGGSQQWENDENGYMMLTTDLALLHDDEYFDIVSDFADDVEVLNIAFGAVWEKLTTNGGTWSANKHCMTAEELDAYDGSVDDSGAYQYGVMAIFSMLAAHFIF